MLSNKPNRRKQNNENTVTNVVLLLDMSGSMDVRRDETIREVNRYLDKLRSDGQRYNITALTFNEYTNELVHRKNIRDVGELEHEEYRPKGWTALLDAVGSTLEYGYNSYDPDERTLFVLITDGQENRSQNYTLSRVRNLIDNRRHSDYYGDFRFVFLGSGPDSWTVGRNLGFNFSVATDYTNPYNTENIYRGLYAASNNFAKCGLITAANLNTSSTNAQVTTPFMKDSNS